MALDAAALRSVNTDKGGDALKTLRRMGIALGSLVAAWLGVWLVGGLLLGSTGGGITATIAVVLLGALIFRDIVRREASSS